MGRIIITSTGSAAMRETIFELGKPSDIGNRVLTQRATQVGYAGSSTMPGREDHRHPVFLLSTVANVSFLTSTAGISEGFARGDHAHYATPAGLPFGGYASNVSVLTSTGGVTNLASRADHVHYLKPEATASNVSWGTSTAGVSSSVSRGDHMHRILPGARVDVTATRGTSQLYTNNGSGPMWIGISVGMSSVPADGVHLEIAGVDVAHADAALGNSVFLMGIANPTEGYLLTCTGGAHIDHWIEYGM